MDSVISNEKKKKFLKWLTKSHKLKTRESLWILDFLYTHESMLEKSHFVENVDQTPRGIYMSVRGTDNGGFRFYKKGHVYEDPVQAFHEVRLNWSSDLYIEVDFEESWQSPRYLAVLEDNPYSSWNNQVSEEMIEEMDWALTYTSLETVRQSILSKINHLLKTGDKKSFEKLVKDLEAIESQIEEMTPRE